MKLVYNAKISLAVLVVRKAHNPWKGLKLYYKFENEKIKSVRKAHNPWKGLKRSDNTQRIGFPVSVRKAHNPWKGLKQAHAQPVRFACGLVRKAHNPWKGLKLPIASELKKQIVSQEGTQSLEGFET